MRMAAFIAGLIAPPVLLVLGGWLNERDLIPTDGPVSAGIGIVAIGVVTGLLLSRWWSIIHAPLVFGVPWVIYQTLSGYSMEPGETTTSGSLLLATGWLVFFSVPYAIGAFLGTALGRLIAEPVELPHLRRRDRSRGGY